MVAIITEQKRAKKHKKLFSIFRSRQYSNNSESKYMTNMHHYKRDLTPVKEIFAHTNDKTPYRDNFLDYEGSLLSSDFKHEILQSLGSRVRCQTQVSGKNRSIQTYFIESEKIPN
jgi:hypothetical protein